MHDQHMRIRRPNVVLDRKASVCTHRRRAKPGMTEGQWSGAIEPPHEGLHLGPVALIEMMYARSIERFERRIRGETVERPMKNAAIDLLTWAAGHDLGHRAFVDLGGADPVFEAAHRAAAGRIPYGVRLDEALGATECVEFLQRVLRDTSQGLSAGRTARLIRDEVRADLSRRFETAESSVLTVLVRHLGLSRILAGAISDVLSATRSVTPAERRSLAQRAKRLEEKADRLTVSAREIAARIREAGMLRPVVDEIENTTDALEDCAFLLSLVPEAEGSVLAVAPLAQLSEIVTDSVGHLVRAVEAASRLPAGRRADAVASLQAIDAVVNAERSADTAERDTMAALIAAACSDARPLVLGLEMARALEKATDHLSHSALSLRDRVLQELSA